MEDRTRHGLLRLRNLLLDMGFELVFDEKGERFEHPDNRVISWDLVKRYWRDVVQVNVDLWYGVLEEYKAVRIEGQGCCN